MNSYEERVSALAKYGMGACDRLVEKHKELFLSIPVKDAFEKIVAVTRLREEIEPPRNEEEAYAILESLLAELLYDGRLKVASYGLSQDGRKSFEYLVQLHEDPASVPVEDPYAEVKELYRTNMAEFQHRRATEPEFLRRSNEADSLKLL